MNAKEDYLSQAEKKIDYYPLPEGWNWVTVNDAGANQKNAIVDGPFGSNLKVSDYVEKGPVPVLTTKNLGGNYDEVRYISKQKFEELKRSAVYPGDILMAKIGSCGKTGIYPSNKPPAMIPANLLKVTLNENFELKYVYHYFNSTFFQKTLRTITKATAQPAFGVTNFRKLPLPYVDRAQQKRIVAEIEKQFSRLDEAVANLKRVKANIKRYKAAVLKAAVEGRLIETEAELARREGRSFETGAQLLQRILETRRSQWQGKGKYKEPAMPDTADLPELPEGWVWATVGQLAAPEPNSITDGPFGSNLKTEHYQESGPRVIRLQNIKDGVFADEYAHISIPHFERLRKHEILAGDLVIASLGDNPPRACIIPSFVGPAIVKADCIRFKPHAALNPAYLNAALNCQPTRKRVKNVLHGIGRPRLSLGEIREIALPIPPETEQYRIVAEVDRHFSLANEAEAQVNANLQRAERLKQSILQSAFTGDFSYGEDQQSS